MRELHEVGTKTFTWRPLKGVKKTIALYAGEGDEVFATFHEERGQPTIAETAAGTWKIEKDRENKKAIMVRGDGGSLVATFVKGKNGEGTLTLTDGQTFRWGPTQKGKAERAFYTASGARVVRFWKDWQILKTEDRGAAEPGMSTLPEFPLLVVLGRYIGIGMDDDVALTVTMTAVT